MKVKIYVEGGGDRAQLHTEFRRALQSLFERTGFKGRMPSFVPIGPRGKAYRAFCNEHRTAGRNGFPVLLVDSEGPVTAHDAWVHLSDLDGWEKPEGAEDDQAQLMVQCMETWIVADRDTLKKHYGHSFRENALPQLDNLESQDKAEVVATLKKATKGCKAPYAKGKPSFSVLGKLNLKSFITNERLPHFARLCDMLERRLAE